MARFAAAISTHGSASTAVGEVVAQIAERIDGRPTLAVLFVTEPHLRRAEDIAATVQTLLEPDALIGSSAVAVLANGQGAEAVPAISLWAGQLDGEVTPFALQVHRGGNGFEVRGFDHDAAATARSALLIPDPFTFPASEFLGQLGRVHPHLVVLGGFASAGRQAGDNRLLLNGTVRSSGAVGVLLDADISPDPVVSQGCRPIGQPWTVTQADGNLLQQLAGRPALERLTELIEALTPEDRALAAQGLHCGIVADEHKDEYQRGDFLIRAVLGADRRTGSVAIGDEVQVGMTVQFQVRDASTAGEDLRALLTGHPGDAALVFTCNGRGTHMFGDADHDARVVQDHLGRQAAVAGMFCAGELGPVAGRNALHGFTASIALFR